MPRRRDSSSDDEAEEELKVPGPAEPAIEDQPATTLDIARDDHGGDGPAETAEPADAAAAKDAPAIDCRDDHIDSRRSGRQEIRWTGPPSSDRGRDRRDNGRDRDDDRSARDERPRERRDGRDDDRYNERRRDDRADGRRDDRRDERRDDRRDDRRPDRREDGRGGGGRGGARDDRERGDQRRERRSDRDAGAAREFANGAPEPAAMEPKPLKAADRPAPAAGKAGGVYIPPFKLAAMMREAKDTESAEYQRLTWDALRKSINGLVNKVNVSNIKFILPEFFSENLVRGRGLLCRSIMKSQMASPPFTNIYAALVAVVNTKFPEIGELLLTRVVLQFRRAYKRNDKPICIAASKFLAHLVNQQVAHEALALEVIFLLLQTPSADSVEVAVSFVKEVGAFLQDISPQALNSVFDRFRAIAHEGEVDKRVQFTIEELYRVRARGFEAEGFAAVLPALDLVDSADQLTHDMALDAENLKAEPGLDVFKADPEYAAHEKEYEAIKKEILGEDDDEEDGDEDDDDDEDETDDEEGGAAAQGGAPGAGPIQDMTETDVINLRRIIYLTIMSSMDFEEAGHKLTKIPLAPGQEMEIVTMILECCSQEKTYIRYYGLMAQRFCLLKREYQELFQDCFRKQYSLIHRLETNKLRNVAKFFAHLLSNDAVSWEVFQYVTLTEDMTTSSSRIFLKTLFQDLSEIMGLIALNKRLQDPSLAQFFDGIFPKDTVRNMRFSINFFTSIGLGGLTDSMREHLANMPKIIAAQQAAALAAARAEAGSDESSSSSDDGSDSDSSDSDSSSDSDDSSSSGSGSDSSDSEPTPPPKKRKAAAVKDEEPAGKRSRRAAEDTVVHANGHAADGHREGGGGRQDHDANGRHENGRSLPPPPDQGRSSDRRRNGHEAEEPRRHRERGSQRDEQEELPPPPSRREQDNEERLPSPPRRRDVAREEDHGDERHRRGDERSGRGNDAGRHRGESRRHGEDRGREGDSSRRRRRADDSESPRASRRRRD